MSKQPKQDWNDNRISKKKNKKIKQSSKEINVTGGIGMTRQEVIREIFKHTTNQMVEDRSWGLEESKKEAREVRESRDYKQED